MAGMDAAEAAVAALEYLADWFEEATVCCELGGVGQHGVLTFLLRRGGRTARVDVTLLSDAPDVALWLDGQPGLAVTRKDVVRVRRGRGRVRLIRDPNKSYFQVLRTKLKWGER